MQLLIVGKTLCIICNGILKKASFNNWNEIVTTCKHYLVQHNLTLLATLTTPTFLIYLFV